VSTGEQPAISRVGVEQLKTGPNYMNFPVMLL